MPSSYTNLLYHIVFSTKDRRPWLAPSIAGRVHEFLGGGIRAQGGVALEVGGMPDHVHLLARLRQDKSLSDAMHDLKANSSGWIHKTFPEAEGFAWQNGFGAFTVSLSQSEDVRQYILDQEEHHKTTTFEEEFTKLFQRHGIEFDERYIWR